MSHATIRDEVPGKGNSEITFDTQLNVPQTRRNFQLSTLEHSTLNTFGSNARRVEREAGPYRPLTFYESIPRPAACYVFSPPLAVPAVERERYLPPSPLNGERAGVRGENSPAPPLAMYLRSGRTATPPCGVASPRGRRWWRFVLSSKHQSAVHSHSNRPTRLADALERVATLPQRSTFSPTFNTSNFQLRTSHLS
jgi:hypothetical protein